MPEKLHRTQILLRPEQHAALARIAAAEGRSLSDLVREFVDLALERRNGGVDAVRQRRERAWEEIQRFREELLAERGGRPLEVDFVEVVNQAREEQDARNFRLIFGPGD